jgi:hypothetical protein
VIRHLKSCIHSARGVRLAGRTEILSLSVIRQDQNGTMKGMTRYSCFYHSPQVVHLSFFDQRHCLQNITRMDGVERAYFVVLSPSRWIPSVYHGFQSRPGHSVQFVRRAFKCLIKIVVTHIVELKKDEATLLTFILAPPPSRFGRYLPVAEGAVFFLELQRSYTVSVWPLTSLSNAFFVPDLK